ncbi:PASTA domain-containing protein [Pseudarthrobacter phenanthrenivorans]|uniref:PASTA domain-containing protein n=1 Tax=Pseudarthrobacter phenanthrenivorans TaxID=361575 RepID=UPI00344EEEA0
MGAQRDPWGEGRNAWERLRAWFGDARDAPPGSAEALGALSDIRQLRYLLDQAELAAVQAARRQGSSWAEVAARLGIARQSAWERWRDLDEAVPTGVVVPAVDAPSARSVEAAAAGLVAPAAGGRRRESNVTVPNVVGLSLDSARTVLVDSKLVAIGPDPDGLPEDASGWPSGVVTDQSPESGASVPIGSPVTLWLGRGGTAGDREPRRPSPGPRSLRAMREEPASDASSGN